MSVTSDNLKSLRYQGSLIRFLLEAVVLLSLSVSVVRTFAAQGYMIETGSMAPGLVGYHRRATCPTCACVFCVGETHTDTLVTCPNCGQAGIDLSTELRNEGDQLLVNRMAFDYQPVKRWGVVVFKNPANPAQAFVKRAVGLPNETLQIIRGDVFLADRIQSKPLAVQRAQRILVYDHNLIPDDADWEPRWLIDPHAAGWEVHGSAFGFDDVSAPANRSEIDPTAASRNLSSAVRVEHTSARPTPTEVAKPPAKSTATTVQPLSTVRYRNWIRSGGHHKTSVRVENWPSGVAMPESVVDLLQYNPQTKLLVCEGALSESRRDILLKGATPDFRKAISSLYDGSHVGPILDVYAYNGSDDESGRREVRDLSLALRFTLIEGQGEFGLGINDGNESFECRFDFGEKQVKLIRLKTDEVVRTAPLTGRWPGSGELELSLMDQQVAVAINGVELFLPWSYPNPATRGKTPWRPVWFGSRNIRARVSDIRLYRDVYYTSNVEGRGVDEPITLGPREFFVLGDNSPVSRDSRSWAEGEILTTELLLGKPFLVHLPSVRRKFQLGNWKTEIRIPEFSRIRYIR